jgi:predicted sulfurtransferase
MRDLNASPGKSDAVSYTCTCNEPGYVLLFYRYWANSPILPEQWLPETVDPERLAAFHREQGDLCNLSGKVRISKEGFNITVAGSEKNVEQYVTACCSHWSFSGLGLDDDTSTSSELQDEVQRNRDEFFKPTPGCRCVFEGILNIRVTAEITPLGVTNYSPSTWEAVRALEPADFHQKCVDEDVKLVDVRNYYESRIGYFVSPTSGEAVKPPIRRFSQWPQWVKEHGDELMENKAESEGLEKSKPQVLTYCTGGIRCEKGVRWMEEYMSKDELRNQGQIYTLKGGIAAYLTWMEAEIAAGRKTAEDSLFKGRNYVFDARGSTGLAGAEPVSTCHSCGIPSGRLSKCVSPGCHLVLVVCPTCELGDVRCCRDCLKLCHEEQGDVSGHRRPRPLCECEQARERELWAGERVKEPKTQGWRTKKRTKEGGQGKKLDIRIKVAE